jgi:hypothetical protein
MKHLSFDTLVIGRMNNSTTKDFIKKSSWHFEVNWFHGYKFSNDIENKSIVIVAKI